MFSLNTNIASLQAQENLRVSSDFQGKTINRVTSGLRIVNSGDDAAGLAIANGYRSDVNVLTQGVRNANDGLSQLQIIDGGMSNISKLLDRARTLATQSASGTFTGDRGVLNDEFKNVIAEIDRQSQAVGLNTGGTFAKSLSVFIGGGRELRMRRFRPTVPLPSIFRRRRWMPKPGPEGCAGERNGRSERHQHKYHRHCHPRRFDQYHFALQRRLHRVLYHQYGLQPCAAPLVSSSLLIPTASPAPLNSPMPLTLPSIAPVLPLPRRPPPSRTPVSALPSSKMPLPVPRTSALTPAPLLFRFVQVTRSPPPLWARSAVLLENSPSANSHSIFRQQLPTAGQIDITFEGGSLSNIGITPSANTGAASAAALNTALAASSAAADFYAVAVDADTFSLVSRSGKDFSVNVDTQGSLVATGSANYSVVDAGSWFNSGGAYVADGKTNGAFSWTNVTTAGAKQSITLTATDDQGTLHSLPSNSTPPPVPISIKRLMKSTTRSALTRTPHCKTSLS